MSKKVKENAVKTFNVANNENQIAMYEKVKNFKTVLGKFVKNEGLNFYYDVDDELLEIVAKTELLDYDIEDDDVLTDLEERTKYSTNTRIALFFGFLEDKVGHFGEYNRSGYIFSDEDFEDIVRGFLFEEDFENFVNIDILNQMLEKE